MNVESICLEYIQNIYNDDISAIVTSWLYYDRWIDRYTKY